MNTTTYFRTLHSKENTYKKISSNLLGDTRLNATAIGLMCMILKNKDSWVINTTILKKQSKLTRDQWEKAWNMLQQYQYIIQKNMGNHSWDYIVNENGDSKMYSGTSSQVHSNYKE